MKIREILNLMEEIEKKHHEKHHEKHHDGGKTYGAYNASGDDELDAPPKTSSQAPVKPSKTGGEAPKMGGGSGGSGGAHSGSKHHQHKDTRAQQLDKEFANIDLDEPEDKGGNKGGKLDKALNELIQHASELGNDLYTITKFNYNTVDTELDKCGSDPLVMPFLEKISRDIPDMKNDVASMKKAVGVRGLIQQIIINGRNGKAFTLSADDTSSGIGQKNWRDMLDDDQIVIVDRIMAAAEGYTDEFRSGKSLGVVQRLREDLLEKLNYHNQKVPDERPEWKKHGFSDEARYIRYLERMRSHREKLYKSSPTNDDNIGREKR